MNAKQVGKAYIPNGATKLPVKFVIAILFLSLITGVSFAQLKKAPLAKKSLYKTIKSKSNARTMGTGPLPLPFWDDFSKLLTDVQGNPTGIPDTAKWETSRSVWVNSGMGINPPSINVATFDGLDSLNKPYEPSQILLNGFTDKLVSRKIDLTTAPAEHQDSIYLRFFYQWRGNGEPPDPTDYMVVEFKNPSGAWLTAFTIQFDQAPDPTVFYDTALHVTDEFFGNEFQFRFRRYGRKSGPFDTWNIDYVYLNYLMIDSKSNDFISVPDRTTTTQLTSFFYPYTSVPYEHWVSAGKPLSNPQFTLTNLKEEAPQNFNYNPSAKISNFKDGVLIDQQLQLLGQKNTPPIQIHQYKTVTVDTLPKIDLFQDIADSVVLDFKVIFNSGDEKLTLPSDYLPRFHPLRFRSNDTLTSRTILYDFYAYDDGFAEYSVALNNSTAATRFDMLVEKDTIVALDIYFPDFALESNQTVDVYIFDDDNGKPGKVLGKRSGYVIRSNGQNKFSRVTFPAVVPVSNNVFYAGWSEPTDGKVKVGLDNSNDTDDKIFEKIGSVWAPSLPLDGAIMIRPVFGGSDVITGLPEENFQSSIACYPNPNNGTFFIRGQYDHLQIINSTGQTIPYQSDNINTETRITLEASPGLYLIKFQRGTLNKTTKLIIK